MATKISDNFNFFIQENTTRVKVGSSSDDIEESELTKAANLAKKNVDKLNASNSSTESDSDNFLRNSGRNAIQQVEDDSTSKGKVNGVGTTLNDAVLNKVTNSIKSLSKAHKEIDIADALESLKRKVGKDSSLSIDDIISNIDFFYPVDSASRLTVLEILRRIKKSLDGKADISSVVIDVNNLLDYANREFTPGQDPKILSFFEQLVEIADTKLSAEILSYLSKCYRRKLTIAHGKALFKLPKFKRAIDSEKVEFENDYEINIDAETVQKYINVIEERNFVVDVLEGSKKYIDILKSKTSKSPSEPKTPEWMKPGWKDSTERRLKQYYSAKGSGASSGSDSTWTKNDYVLKLNAAMNYGPEGLTPVAFDKLMIQMYHMKGTKAKSNVSVKGGVVQSKELAYTDAININTLNEKFYEVDESGKVKIFTYSINPVVLKPHLPVSDESKIKQLSDAVEDTTAVANLERQYKICNYSIECLLRRMPDFTPNLYYGVISQVKNDDEVTYDIKEITEDKSLYSTSLGDPLLDILDTYFVRLQEVSINGMSVEPMSWKFLGRDIKKPQSLMSETHKAELVFKLDQNGILLRKFNAMAAIYGDNAVGEDASYYGSTFFPSSFYNSNHGEITLTLMYNDYSFNRKDPEAEKHQSTFGPMQKLIMNDEMKVGNFKQKKTFGYYGSYRALVLEGVKFLGVSGGLKFNRDAAGSQNITVPVLYRRISTIDNNF